MKAQRFSKFAFFDLAALIKFQVSISISSQVTRIKPGLVTPRNHPNSGLIIELGRQSNRHGDTGSLLVETYGRYRLNGENDSLLIGALAGCRQFVYNLPHFSTATTDFHKHDRFISCLLCLSIALSMNFLISPQVVVRDFSIILYRVMLRIAPCLVVHLPIEIRLHY